MESKSKSFVLVVHNVAANLLFEKSLGLENQGKPHSLSLSGVKAERAAEMRYFSWKKISWLCLLTFAVLTDKKLMFFLSCHGQGRCAEVTLGDTV